MANSAAGNFVLRQEVARLVAAATIGVVVGASLATYITRKRPRNLCVGTRDAPSSATTTKAGPPTIRKNGAVVANRSCVRDSGVIWTDEGATEVKREVICAEALEWLRRPGAVKAGSMIYTSLPDSSEVQETIPTLEGWKVWFQEAAGCVLEAVPPDGIAVFYQTDVRDNIVGHLSKSFLVLQAAAQAKDIEMLWHKVCHFGSIDELAFQKCRFTHLLCFWRRPTPSTPFPDLGTTIPDLLSRGEKPWGLKNSARCMGINASMTILEWVAKRFPEVDTIVDPFCGAGTALALANQLGLHAVGVDSSTKRVKQAKALDGATLVAGRHNCLGERNDGHQPSAKAPVHAKRQGSSKAAARAAKRNNS